MVFNSVVFLFCFLPLSLLLYYLVPGRAKNAVLLAESLLFYCWTGVAFLPLIAVLIVFNYLWGLLTARARTTLRGLLPLAAVLVNLGVLVYFKYANFLIDTLNQIGHLGIAALNIGTVLPLGISYYIFKIISYEADVYTGKIEPERNPLTFAVYVLFFPQLIVGPIVKYREMADQLHDSKNRCTMEKAQRGAELFQIVGAGNPARPLPRLVQRRQQHRRQNGDDRDHYEEFDQRKKSSSFRLHDSLLWVGESVFVSAFQNCLSV